MTIVGPVFMIDNIITVNGTEGQSLSVAGNAYRIIISGKQTSGEYAVIDMLVPPGGGPGPHSHTDIEEMFYVVDGEVEFKTESGKYTSKKGALINIPKGGAIHSFKNTSKAEAHLLCTVIPAGLDAFFEEIGTPVAPGTFMPPTVPDAAAMARLKELGEQYGQQFYPPDYLD